MKPTIAVDLAKSVFEIAVSQQPGNVAERHRREILSARRQETQHFNNGP